MTKQHPKTSKMKPMPLPEDEGDNNDIDLLYSKENKLQPIQIVWEDAWADRDIKEDDFDRMLLYSKEKFIQHEVGFLIEANKEHVSWCEKYVKDHHKTYFHNIHSIPRAIVRELRVLKTKEQII